MCLWDTSYATITLKIIKNGQVTIPKYFTLNQINKLEKTAQIIVLFRKKKNKIFNIEHTFIKKNI